MSWLSKAIKKVNNFVAKVDPIAKNTPEFQMQKRAFEAGNWDKPYGEDASGWDFLGAGPVAQITKNDKTVGGVLDPRDPEDRAKGRAIGTAVADYWTFGLFSQLAVPNAPTMNLENNGDRLAFSSLSSPGVVTSTNDFVADLSSVTPSQAQLAASMENIKKWAWYGVAILAVFLILTRKGN